VIHERVRCLTGWLLHELLALRQTNGAPLVRLYGPRTRTPRRHRHVQLLQRGRPRHRPSHRRAARQRGEDLLAHRLFL
jgi:hypothetical protein